MTEGKSKNNTQLKHFKLMKGLSADVATVINTTGVMNAKHLLI